MAFLPKSDYRQEQTQRALLQVSLTFKVGDIVALIGSGATTYQTILTNATGSVVGALYPVGVLVGFSKQNGEVISQGQDPTNTPNQLTTTATNISTEKYYGVFLPITSEMEFVGDLDAVAGTTNYADQYGVYFDLTDCRTITEASVDLPTAVASDDQILSLGVNPLNTKQIFCKIIKNLYTRHYTG